LHPCLLPNFFSIINNIQIKYPLKWHDYLTTELFLKQIILKNLLMANTTTTSKNAAATNGKSSASFNGKMASTNGIGPKSSTKKTPSPQIMGEVTKQPKENDSRLEEFFHDELKDIYWAEKHLVKTLPKMQKAASSPDLKNAFIEHLDVTKGHVLRLEEVFGILGKKPQAKKCDAMEGITKEGESIIEDTDSGTSTRDVGLILAAQKVEHYEIATYGGLAQLAKTLGYAEISSILETTLGEEKEADHNLTSLAENTINESAASED